MIIKIVSVLFMLFPLFPTRDPVVGEPYVIVNKSMNQLAYINNGEIVRTFQVATGKNPSLTPIGEFKIIVFAKNPYYRKKNIPGGDPRNPLGTRWIGFDALGTDGRIFGLHGTNHPESIGTYATHGCIRLRKKDIEWLYDQIPFGTKIWIVQSNQTFEQLARVKGLLR